MNRGDIHFIEETCHENGSEQRGNRPAVIVSNNKNNERSGTVEVVYMTTQAKKDLPTHVVINSSRRRSTVLCEQIHTVSKDRVGKMLGTVTEQEAAAIDRALAISLGIELKTGTCPSDCPGAISIDRDHAEEKQAPTTETLAFAYVEVLKANTERDTYRKLYTDLLAIITKGGAE